MCRFHTPVVVLSVDTRTAQPKAVGLFGDSNPAHVPCLWVNNPTLREFCFAMIGRADIEGSKSNVAMSAWLPQASSLVPGQTRGRAFPLIPSSAL